MSFFVPEGLPFGHQLHAGFDIVHGHGKPGEVAGVWGCGRGIGEGIAEMERKVHIQPAFVCDNACAVERERPFDNNF